MDGSPSVWDAVGLRELGPLPVATSNVTRIIRSPDGRCLVVGSKEGTIIVLDAVSRRGVTNLVQHTAMAFPVGYVAHGNLLVTVDATGVIHQWDTKSWQVQSTVKAFDEFWTGPNYVVLAPESEVLIFASRLEALLAAHEQPDSVLPVQPETDQLTRKDECADDALDDGVGQTIGRYQAR